MSADAKVWTDASGWVWRGFHDGPCVQDVNPHDQGESLTELLGDIERCLGQTIRWELREYPDHSLGLSGYLV